MTRDEFEEAFGPDAAVLWAAASRERVREGDRAAFFLARGCAGAELAPEPAEKGNIDASDDEEVDKALAYAEWEEEARRHAAALAEWEREMAGCVSGEGEDSAKRVPPLEPQGQWVTQAGFYTLLGAQDSADPEPPPGDIDSSDDEKIELALAHAAWEDTARRRAEVAQRWEVATPEPWDHGEDARFLFPHASDSENGLQRPASEYVKRDVFAARLGLDSTEISALWRLAPALAGSEKRTAAARAAFFLARGCAGAELAREPADKGNIDASDDEEVDKALAYAEWEEEARRHAAALAEWERELEDAVVPNGVRTTGLDRLAFFVDRGCTADHLPEEPEKGDIDASDDEEIEKALAFAEWEDEKRKYDVAESQWNALQASRARPKRSSAAARAAFFLAKGCAGVELAPEPAEKGNIDASDDEEVDKALAYAEWEEEARRHAAALAEWEREKGGLSDAESESDSGEHCGNARRALPAGCTPVARPAFFAALGVPPVLAADAGEAESRRYAHAVRRWEQAPAARALGGSAAPPVAVQPSEPPAEQPEASGTPEQRKRRRRGRGQAKSPREGVAEREPPPKPVSIPVPAEVEAAVAKELQRYRNPENPLAEHIDLRRKPDAKHTPCCVREYVDQCLSPELDALVVRLMQDLKQFQLRLRVEQPLKYKAKQRYVIGLRECLRAADSGRLRAAVVVPDIDASRDVGGLDHVVGRILELCRGRGVPIVFCLSKRTLGVKCFGRALRKTSCIGVYSADGANETFRRIIDLSAELRQQYEAVLQLHPELVPEAERRRREAEEERRRAEAEAEQEQRERERLRKERLRQAEESRELPKRERKAALRAARQRERQGVERHAGPKQEPPAEDEGTAGHATDH